MRQRIPLPVEDVAAAYVAGATMDELATRYGVSRTPIRRAIHSAGSSSRPGGRPQPDADEVQAITDGYRAGMTIDELAAKFGRGRNGIRRALDRAGVPPRGTGRPNPFVGLEALLAEEYRAGATIRALMSKHGGSDKTIRATIVSQGVPIRPRGPGRTVD